MKGDHTKKSDCISAVVGTPLILKDNYWDPNDYHGSILNVELLLAGLSRFNQSDTNYLSSWDNCNFRIMAEEAKAKKIGIWSESK